MRHTPAPDPSTVLGPAGVLQSEPWHRFQAALGRATHLFSGPGWHALVVEETSRAGRLWYAPYGPVLSHPEALPDALTELRSAARAARIGWLRVEPQAAASSGEGFEDAVRRQNATAPVLAAALTAHGARPAPRDIQPAYTRWVDLTPEPGGILGAMTGTNRNLWRRHRDKGITLESSTHPSGADAVIELLHRTAGRRGFTAHGSDYLRTAARVLRETGSCTAYTSSVDGTVVSALLTYDSPTTRVFAHSGMDAALRKLRPNQPLIVQALLDAAAQGQHVADLFGVASANDPGHPWTGFSAFKRSFGGADVALGGTWDLPVSAPRYAAYRVARRARDEVSTVRGRARGAADTARARLHPER